MKWAFAILVVLGALTVAGCGGSDTTTRTVTVTTDRDAASINPRPSKATVALGLLAGVTRESE
jgi:hypothetical protein